MQAGRTLVILAFKVTISTTSLCLSFPISKMEIMTVPTSQGFVTIK